MNISTDAEAGKLVCTVAPRRDLAATSKVGMVIWVRVLSTWPDRDGHDFLPIGGIHTRPEPRQPRYKHDMPNGWDNELYIPSRVMSPIL
jgi:hypothetical protein